MFSDDEDEGEEDYRWDDNESVDVPPSFSTEQQTPPSQPDDDFNSEARANSWTSNNKRKRTSCGQTKHSTYNQRKRARKDNARRNSRRLTEKFLSWASTGKQYNKAKGKVNELYLMSLEFGVIKMFYERKIHLKRT